MQTHEHLTIIEACRDLVLRSVAALDANDVRQLAVQTSAGRLIQ